MEINKIYNEKCQITLERMIGENQIVDAVLTSPFYNTNSKAGKSTTIFNCNYNKKNYPYVRYDVFVDNMSDEEYTNFTMELFDKFDKIVKRGGLYYGTFLMAQKVLPN